MPLVHKRLPKRFQPRHHPTLGHFRFQIHQLKREFAYCISLENNSFVSVGNYKCLGGFQWIDCRQYHLEWYQINRVLSVHERELTFQIVP